MSRGEIRVALVTGADGGIGRSVVRALREAGLQVVATDRRFGESGHSDPDVIRHPMDVTRPESVQRVARRLAEEQGRLDVLVNSAGVFERTPVLALDEEALHRVLEVNLCGTLRCIAHLGALMAEGGGGRIINIASISALTGAPLGSVYAASKAGVVAVTRSLVRELAPRNIWVCAVLPGFCETPLLVEDPLFRQFVLPRIPAGRLARPEEVAEVVRFLATCQTDYLSGAMVTVDGGLSVG